MAQLPFTQLVSYEMKGVKESFANWVSNISPQDTPFVSMTGKFTIGNKIFNWQSDTLAAAALNSVIEGSDAAYAALAPTQVRENVTQILRKTVSVSDTANALENWGRGKELQYQMEKAAAEIKRDLEKVLLSEQGIDKGTFTAGTGGAPASLTERKTGAFQYLVGEVPSGGYVAKGNVGTIPEDATQSVIVKSGSATTFTEADLNKVFEALYTTGAKPSVVMFHPKWAKVFSGWMEKAGTTAAAGATRVKMFDGATDVKVNTQVNVYVDALGQEFKLIPNRFMPADAIYVFNPNDWEQAVLRAPKRTELAKTGSSEKWMIEMEVGLRHRNPLASGILFLA